MLNKGLSNSQPQDNFSCFSSLVITVPVLDSLPAAGIVRIVATGIASLISISLQ